MRVLITTTSFQDTPGPHHKLLEQSDHQLVKARGPLSEQEMLDQVGEIDGTICGDDAFTRNVMQKALPRLKVISKYGIGLDKIDLEAAFDLGIPVCFTPGVNHTTVAEHIFGLMIGLCRNIPQEDALIKAGNWKRITGHELMGKTLGILGLGRIGKEVAVRALAFQMRVVAFDIAPDRDFLAKHPVNLLDSPRAVLREAELLSLNMNLTAANRRFINRETLCEMKDGIYIVNCARGGLVDEGDLAEALHSGHVAGYACDVLDHEPPEQGNPLVGLDNVIVTPHIGSRTYESVARQAEMATRNLLLMLSGKSPLAQVKR